MKLAQVFTCLKKTYYALTNSINHQLQ